MNGSIYVTSGFREEVQGKKTLKFPVLKRIYFAGKNGDVSKTFDIFPKGTKALAADVYAYDSKKYIAINRLYRLKNNEVSDCEILNLNGTVLFNQRNNGSLFISDSLNRFAFAGPMDGQLKIFDDKGNLLKEEKYSDFTEISEDDEEADPLRISAGKVADDGSCFSFTRYKPSKNLFYEMNLIDFDGNVKMKKRINDWLGYTKCISSEEKIIVVFEQKMNPTQDRYVGYDFDGELKWILNSPKSIFKDGLINSRFLISKDQNQRLDIRTGKIVQ
jgi:hypothetical protein